jgi:hypothetical protein
MLLFFLSFFLSSYAPQVTNSETRDWVIPPTGNNVELPIWAMVAAILPGILLYIILFIETEICQLIIIERTKVQCP